MNNFNNVSVSKIFSIPGRIRLKIKDLRENSSYASNIENSLINIYSVKTVMANIKTGNLLIIYDSDRINENELLSRIKNFNINTETNQITKRYKPNNRYKTKSSFRELFQEEISLSKRLFIVSVTTASLLFITTSPIGAISVLLLGAPGVIFMNSYLSMRYTLIKAKQNEIHISNVSVIREIQNLTSISLYPNVIFQSKINENIYAMQAIEIETMVAGGEIEDPIPVEVRRLVKELRELGVNDITIYHKGNNIGIFIYANKNFGFETAERDLSDLIIIGEEALNKKLNHKIILCISKNNTIPWKMAQISCRDINKIAWLFQQCMRSNELLTRSQVTTVSIQIFGIMLAFIGFLNIGTSVILYGLNVLGNSIYLKHSILMNKEKGYGQQREYLKA